MSADPFDTLKTMELDFKKNSRPLPREQALGRSWQGIGFKSAGVHFVSPLTEIKEVLTLPPITQLPGSASWFLGVANLRGRAIPITDLQNFVKGEPSKITPLSRILIIDFDKEGVGFLVNQVLGVERFAERSKISNEQIKDTDIEKKFIPYLQGKFEENTHKAYILSLKALSETPQFYQIVKDVGG